MEAAVPAEATLIVAEQSFSGRPIEVSAARRFVRSVLDIAWPGDGYPLLVMLSELATNAVIHSASGVPGGSFTVRVVIQPGRWLRLEISDGGGVWSGRAPDEVRGHGLEIVESIAAEWGREGDPVTGWTVWARVDWPGR